MIGEDKMKKIIALILVLIFVFTLSACGNKDTASDTNISAPTSSETFVKPENYTTVLLVSINPQFKLYLDESNKVLAVEPVNDDAKSFCDNIGFENKSVEAVVGNIVEKANEKGFIKGNAVVNFKITEQKDGVDSSNILTTVVSAANQKATELKIEIKVETKESDNSQTTETTSENKQTGESSKTETSSKNEGNTSKPTTTTKPTESKPTHTHSYSAATCTTPQKCSCGETKGSALGHKWQDATCKAPKTCSVCKKTEGNKAEHIVEGTTCKWCKQVVVVNPNKLNANIEYTHLSPKFYREFEWNSQPPKEYDCYVLIQLRLKDLTCGDEVFLETNTPLYSDDYYHNGKYYLQLCQWCDIFYTSYKIEGSEIVVTLTTYDCEDKQVFTFELLSDNTLRVKSISGSELIPLSQHSGLKVGSIFYPNPHRRFD